MKSTLPWSLLLLNCSVAAQGLELGGPTVVSGGGAAADESYRISATIGEPATVSHNQDSVTVLPGFWPIVNAHRGPVPHYNSSSFGMVTERGTEAMFDLIIFNEGDYPLEYQIQSEVPGEQEWMQVSDVAGQVAEGRQDTVTVSVEESEDLSPGAYGGVLRIATNSGKGRSTAMDIVRVDLLVLPDSAEFVTGNATVPAGDPPPLELTDGNGNELGITLDFGETDGGDVTATLVPSSPPMDGSTSFDDPDNLVTDAIYGDFFWEISTTITHGFSADIGFDYSRQNGVGNPNLLRLARRMNRAGPGVPWEFLDTGSVVIDEASGTITALSQDGFSQWTVASDRGDNAFEDSQGPTLSRPTVIPSTPHAGEPVEIATTVSDESSVEKVILQYIRGGQTDFDELVMTANERGVYRGFIPGTSVTQTGVACVVRAVDTPGYVTTSDTLFVNVQFPGGALSTDTEGSAFPDGIPKERWRLISVPAHVDDRKINDIFGDEWGSDASKTTWRMFEWTGDGWGVPVETEVGEGYWVYQRVNEAVAITTGPGRSVSLEGVELELEPGWNIIGSPYSFPVELSLDPSRFYGPVTYGIGGKEGWSDPVSTIHPWGGYIVFNREDSVETVRVKPLHGAGSLAGTRGARDGWTIRLMASGERYADVSTILGRKSGASEGLDRFDNPEPPYINGYVSLTFDSSAAPTGTLRLTSDIRSLEQTDGTWDANLYVKGERSPIQLEHEISGTMPADVDVILLDLVTRRSYDLVTGGGKIFFTDYVPAGRTSDESVPYPLKIVVGSPEYVDRTVSRALARLPEKIALSQNYPNPFNPDTRIEYSLPSPLPVNLTIHNVLGQEVIVLVDEMKEGGYHHVIWNGTDRYGREVASGMYVSILSAGNRVLIRKLMVIR